MLLVANHNAYEPQENVTVTLQRKFSKVSGFDRAKCRWRRLSVRGNKVRFAAGPAGIELLKFEEPPGQKH